jgi:hypothetical protein
LTHDAAIIEAAESVLAETGIAKAMFAARSRVEQHRSQVLMHEKLRPEAHGSRREKMAPLSSILRRCIAQDSAQRFGSVEEILSLLGEPLPPGLPQADG